MSDSHNFSIELSSQIELVKQVDRNGKEFWSARKLMPILGYASWMKFSAVGQDVYSSFCLENPSQAEMIRSWMTVKIGSGALRTIEAWRLSRLGVERLLARAAISKPEAVRQLRSRNVDQFRIETDIGAILMGFCDSAGLTITHQKMLERYRFDYCIDNQLLVEIDEAHHRFNSSQVKRDKLKTELAAMNGYKLLRIQIPIESTAKLCGLIVSLLNERQD